MQAKVKVKVAEAKVIGRCVITSSRHHYRQRPRDLADTQTNWKLKNRKTHDDHFDDTSADTRGGLTVCC